MSQIEVLSEVTGKVWKIEARPGQRIEADEPIVIVESMKMEIPVTSMDPGTLVELRVQEGDAVEEGQVIAILAP